MIDFASLAIKNRLLTCLVIVISLVGGLYAYANMPRFEDPEFLIRTAVVITEYPGATPTEVANEVTNPLETAIQQLADVDEIVSTSSAGLSRIEVTIKYEASPTKPALQQVWNKLRNKVNDSQYQLPPGAQGSFVNDDFGDVYGIYYAITGEGYSYKELEDYAKKLRTDVLSVDGVAKVALSGVQEESIYISLSEARINALGLRLGAVFAQLSEQNSVNPAGNVLNGNRRLRIQPTGVIDSVKDIENMIASTDDTGTVVYLRDIADVTRTYRTPVVSELRYNGVQAIGFGISNVTGANVVKMATDIEAKLKAVENQRPIGVELHEYYNQGNVTEISINDFVKNVALALAIVLVTLLCFMGIRSAAIIGGVLLLTIAATLATMYWAGIPMHRISLGALIIALGMLVDNAIVVTEGILVGTQRGQDRFAVIRKVVKRSTWPLLGGTLVGILAFAPIGLAPGDTAEYTNHLFWVVLISLMYSWVFAISIVPFLCEIFLRQSRKVSGVVLDRAPMRIYKRFMRAVINYRWIPISFTAALFVCSIWGFQFVKEGFFPTSTTPQLVIDYWAPEGTDISQTRADMLEIEKEISGRAEISAFQTLIGEGAFRYMLIYEGESANSSYGQFLIKVKNYDDIPTLIADFQAHIDNNFPDAQSKVWQFQLGPSTGPKVQAEFSGPDPAVLRRLAEDAKNILVQDGRAISIQDDWRQPVSVIEPVYSSSSGRRLGVSRKDLAAGLQTHFSGTPIGVYREKDKLIPILARTAEESRLSVSTIDQVQIVSPVTGAVVPLGQVVDGIEVNWRNSLIKTKDRILRIKAQADPISGDLASDLLNRVRPKIEAIPLPPGYQLTWGGEYGDSKEANENLAKALPLGLLAMVLVVVVLFGALLQPLVIWLVVPLALIGVVPGLLITGTAMEFMAILGLLSLSGLLIKNAIVLVDQMDMEISEGKKRYDAILDSAASRVRPVMMGALTTILGVLPLLNDAFFKSMAVVLVFGLSFATALTLILVPALYALFFKIDRTESEVA